MALARQHAKNCCWWCERGGGGGVGTVNRWFVMPPLEAPPSPPVVLARVAGGS